MSKDRKSNGSGRKFSKTGLVLVGCSLVCVILALAVGLPDGFLGDGGKGGDLDDENTPGIEDIMEGETPLMVFDKSDDGKKLMQAFDEGKIVEVSIAGNSESGISDDQAKIKEVYKAMKNIMVGDRIDKSQSKGDSTSEGDRHVIFTLEDGTEITYSFEGDSVLCYGGSSSASKGNYAVEGTEQMWEAADSLTE